MFLPFENNTCKVVRQLAKRSIKTEKRRNIMVVIAILLATFLMSMCGTAMFSFSNSQNNMAAFEVTYHDLTKDKFDILKQKPEIEIVGKIYNLGQWKTREGNIISLAYMDENSLYIARKQFELIDGTLPSASNEIAADKAFLDSFAPDCYVGSTISIPINEKNIEFTISAIIAPLARAPKHYSFYVSDEFIQNSPNYNPSAYQAYIHFKNADAISKEELKMMGAEIGKEIDAKLSYSFLYFRDNKNVSIGNTLIFTGLVILVMFAGSIVIQSAFRISINEKIRSYGQLRTLGATQKQIRQSVKYESHKMSLIGIPAGLALGGIAGTIMGGNQYASGFSLTNTIFVSVLVALISLLMVEISIYKPVKIAANTSPMEAIRFTPNQDVYNHERKIHKKLNPLRLALLNLRRDKKRAASTLLSLSFGGLLLFISASMSVTYSIEQSVRAKLFVNDGDFRIYLSEEDLTNQIRGGTPLNEALRQQILAIDGVKDVVPLRDSVGEFTYTKEDLQSDNGLCDIISPDKAAEGRYGFVAENLIEGRMPENKTEALAIDLLLEMSHLSLGDNITITVNKKAVDVTIVGFYDCTYVGTENGYTAEDGPNLMITEQLAQELIPEADKFDYSWEIITEPSKDMQVQIELENLLAHAGTVVSLCSVHDEIAFMTSQMNLLYGGLQFLSILIFLFGVVNLINMTLANQHSRRQENSVMRSVGLTRKQLYQMMISEGLLYIVFSTVAVIIAGIPFSIMLINTIGSSFDLPFMPYKFPIAYMVIYIIILLLLQLILSIWSIKDINKRSLVEQLRIVE